MVVLASEDTHKEVLTMVVEVVEAGMEEVGLLSLVAVVAVRVI
jgi:hypothetical protein